MYQEPQPTRTRLGLLLLTAAALYLSAICILEIRLADEAYYAALARSVLSGRSFLPHNLSGYEIKAFPLYPWLVAIFAGLRAPISVLPVRLPSLLSLWGLACLSGLTARQLKDNQAGFIAAMVVLFSFASMKTGLRGQPEPLHALLLNAAWLTWYLHGPQKQHWAMAWSGALAFVFLDFLTVGVKAIPCFYLPILLTRVPHQVRRQLRTSAHLLCLGMLLLCLIIYLTAGHPPIWSLDDVCNRAASKFFTEGFLHHLVFFPAKTAVYFLPWTIFAWAPFCEAQLPYEPKGSAGGFLRAIVVPLFVICWLMPSRSPLHLLPLIGPMAILIGFHFEITMRRLHDFYTRLMDWAAGAIAAYAALAFLVWLTIANPERLVRITSRQPSRLYLDGLNRPFSIYLPLGIAVLITARYLLPRRDAPSLSVGSRLLLTFLSAGLITISTVLPLKAAFSDYRRDNAYALMKLDSIRQRKALNAMPPQELGHLPFFFDRDVQKIYLQSTELFLAESFHFRCPVQFISSPATDIPGTEETVYLLTTGVPIAPERIWEQLAGPVDMTPKYPDDQKIWLRLYRGRLRPAPPERPASTESTAP